MGTVRALLASGAEHHPTTVYWPAQDVWAVVPAHVDGADHPTLCTILHVPTGRSVAAAHSSDEAILICRIMHEVLPGFGAELDFDGILPPPPDELNYALEAAGAPIMFIRRSP